MRYRAFISYASADIEIGARFQRAIEHFKIPKPLRGIDYGFGPLPKRLTPLFRDRSDANAGYNLPATFRAALMDSDALVVLCSPVSARSKWVHEEIKTFKALGRSTRIYSVIVAGAPYRHDPEVSPDGAFPPALFQRFDSDGVLIADEEPEPLAADLGATGDGPNFAMLKVVAGITGVPLALLTMRQFEAERRERLIVRGVAVAMAFLAILASGAAIQAWRSEKNARARLEDAIEMAARRVDDAAQFNPRFGVPSDVIRQLLEGAQRDFEVLVSAPNTRTPTLELQRGRLLAMFSDLYGSVGNSERQLALARQGLAAIDGVTTSRVLLKPTTWWTSLPDSAAVVRERLGALQALGVALSDNEGGIEEAMAVFESGRKLAEKSNNGLFAARFRSLTGKLHYNNGDPMKALEDHEFAIRVLDAVIAEGGEDKADAQLEKAFARSDRAQMLLELGRYDEALAEQTSSTEFFEAEATRTASNSEAQQGLAHALGRQGDVLYAARNDWKQSIPVFERAIEILRRIHAADPARMDYGRDLSIALDHIGDALLQGKDVRAAKPHFDESLALRRDILARDPISKDARRDVAVALERQSDTAMELGEPRQALAALDEARVVRQGAEPREAPGDPVLTRDMAVYWSKTARARAAIRDPQDWRQAYATAIRLMEPLIEMKNAAPGWMRDLAVFQTDYADALARTGANAQAVTHWSAALQLIERQLSVDPDDTQLLADAALLRSRILKAGGGRH